MTAVDRHGRTAALDVVIVTHDSSATIDRCLERLTDPRLHVVVVDNGSRDDTVARVRARGVTIIGRPDNPGFGTACNVGTAAGRSADVAFINPDLFTTAADLCRCVDQLAARPDVGIVGVRLVQADGTLDHACKRTVVGPLDAFRFLIARRDGAAYLAPHVGEHETGVVDAVNGCFMVMARADAEALGPFDERYWMYAEDLDLCLRCHRDLGKSVLYWPEVTATHLKGASTGRARSVRLNYHFFRSAWILYLTHRADGDGVAVRAVVLAGLVAFGTARTLNDQIRRTRARLGRRRSTS